MLRLRILFTLVIVGLTLTIALAAWAQPSIIPVALPVQGQLVFPSGPFLYRIDTHTGQMQTLLNGRSENRNFGSPYWDITGNRLTYTASGRHSSIFDRATGTEQVVDHFPPYHADYLFSPTGWSNDGTNILYRVGFIQSFYSIIYTFHLMDVNTKVLTTISTTFERGQLLPADFPLLPGVNQALLSSFTHIRRNPTHDQWVLLQGEAYDAALTSDLASAIADNPSEAYIRINVLWNYVTGQMISLDGLFASPMFSEAVWSRNGELLLVPTLEDGDAILRLDNLDTNPSITVIDTVTTERVIQYWLDADNLLIAQGRDTNTDDKIYYVGQVIDGTWYETEFFRLPEFADIGTTRGDWYLNASETEKRALTCLFDQALPTQLAIGTRARVNFTNGLPLRLRAEPSIRAAEIQQMPEGTEFTIIGGPACQNAENYYRFWQVQLDDATIGWAAEATPGDYFIEPVPDGSA